MKKYYYTDGRVRYGPYSFDELKEQNISRHTLIWYEGLDNWVKAGDSEDFKDFFSKIPPPIGNIQTENKNQDQKQAPPKSWLTESILVTIFCCLPFGIPGIVNAAKVESRFTAGNYTGAQRASNEAKKWTQLSFWLGIIVIILYVIFGVFSGPSYY